MNGKEGPWVGNDDVKKVCGSTRMDEGMEWLMFVQSFQRKIDFDALIVSKTDDANTFKECDQALNTH